MNVEVAKARFHEAFDSAVLERLSEDWGWRIPVGLTEIHRIGYATTLTPETVVEARDKGVQLIVTHHDAWPFMREVRDQALLTLDVFGIAHCFIHAPLDGADFGTSASLLKAIGCEKQESFCDYMGVMAGRIGELDAPESFADFERRVSQSTGEPPRAMLEGKKPPKRIAVVTGGGNRTDYVKEAIDLGCDTFITGEMGLYFLSYCRYKAINALVYTHNATEIRGAESLATKLAGPHAEAEIIRLSDEPY